MLVHQYRGTMGVGTVDKMYRDTNANYELDAKQSAPELPKGVDERLYEPDVRHALIAKHHVVAGGPMPWPEGDAIIKTMDGLLAAQRERQTASVEEARKRLNDEVEREFERQKGVVAEQLRRGEEMRAKAVQRRQQLEGK
jgi:hypothetical protein